MKRSKVIYMEGIISILVNVALFVIKYIVGIGTHSLAIVADAWHSLSDSLTSIIVILGTKASQKPPDEEHPFGHGRAELIAQIVIGVLLGVVSFEFFYKSLGRLIRGEGVNYTIWAKVVIGISIVTKECLAQYAFYSYRKTNASILKADGWHHRSDALSSLMVLGGIFLGRYIWWIDGLLGLVISLFIGHAAVEIIREAMNPLLGEAPSEEIVNEVKKICALYSYLGDLSAHHFHIHNYGTHKELTFHLMFPGKLSIRECHDIATKIEERIRKELGIEATIHLESK